MGEPLPCPSCRTIIDMETGGKPPQCCPHCGAEIVTGPADNGRGRRLRRWVLPTLVGLAIIGIALVLSRTSELSRRLVCGANMKGISACMKIYGSERESFRADPFRALLDSGRITAEQLVCPSSGKTVRDIEEDPYACYVPVVYDVPASEGGTISSATILLYERDNHGGQGGNVLYADGHCTFVRPYAEVLRQVEESMRRSATSQPAADGGGWESN